MSDVLKGAEQRASPRKARRRFAITPKFIAGYGVVIGFSIVILALFVADYGSFLNLTFPVVATGLAIFLYVYRRSVYVAFVWWIWLFTPEVRRLVDYQSSYHAISPVMVTPLLVTAICAQNILSRPALLRQRKALPLAMFGLVLFYGLILGLVQHTAATTLYEFLDWLIPLLFGLYLINDGGRFDENRVALLNAMMIGLLGISLYGLYQFYHLPAWDAYWINASRFITAGVAESEQVRLFGPLNSPFPYGISLMAPLVIALVRGGPVTIFAAIVGVPAFGLCLVRSAWIGWIVASLYTGFRIGGKLKVRLIFVLAFVCVAVVPLLTVGPVSDIISKRLQTFSDVQQDASFQARRSIYENYISDAFSDPLGSGLGGAEAQNSSGVGLITGVDSGVIDIFQKFGWVGAGIMFWSIVAISRAAMFARRSSVDRIQIAAAGIVGAMLIENFSALVLVGVTGIIFWSAIALACSGYFNGAGKR